MLAFRAALSAAIFFYKKGFSLQSLTHTQDGNYINGAENFTISFSPKRTYFVVRQSKKSAFSAAFDVDSCNL